MHAKRQVDLLSKSPASAVSNSDARKVGAAIPLDLPIEMAVTTHGHALQASTRSPSVIPAALPDRMVTREEMNTSEKYGSLMPGSEFRRPSEVLSGPVAVSTNVMDTGDPELARFFIVPTPLLGHQRDQYFSETYYHDALIRDYLDSPGPPSSEQEAQLRNLLRRLRHTVVHPDLNNPDTATQHADSPVRQARWDVDCSAKFRFLQTLFERLRETSLTIAIIASGQRTCDILATFFRGLSIRCNLSDEQRDDSTPDFGVTAWVVKYEAHLDGNSPEFDGVVVLDGDSNATDENLRALRRSRNGEWLPTFILAVPRSIEHLDRHTSPILTGKARLRALVSGVYQLKHDAGRPEAGQVSAEEAALAAATLLVSATNIAWQIPGLSTLQDVLIDSQTDSEPTAMLNGDDMFMMDSSGIAQKRSHSRMDSNSLKLSTSPVTKRVRAEEEIHVPTTVNLQDVEITHISDSIGRPTQQSEREEFRSSLDEPFLAREKRITQLYHATEARLKTITKDLELVQYRLEEERQLFLTCRKERDALVAKGDATVERMASLNAQNASLRAERTELKAQLESAHQRLINDAVPERKEVEELHLAMARVQLESEKATKRAEAAERDTEYTRSMYQDSSFRAQELAQQNATLLTRVAQLEHVASGEQARAQQASKMSHDANLTRQNQQLKAMLKDREAGLKFRDEEIARLKEAGRGRIGTRASSVPRSPRHGSPFMLAGRGPGSRQTSPAATTGARSHPLRNANAG
jgi:hypothetical protein